MKKLLTLITAALLIGIAAPRGEAVSVSVFYESLEPHGEWIDVGDYGYVFHPRDVDEEWRPYTVGNWAYTDAGWTWVSEEPHGWATHHYGRWARVEGTGWVWVPDVEWGPAWVSWRRSTKHVGWAPLPPEARISRTTTVSISNWADSYYDIGPTSYSFVEVRNFGTPRLRTVVLPPRENIVIINETRNITNITYQNNIVFNGGPEYDVIVRESAQPIRRLRLEREVNVDIAGGFRGDRFRSRVEGESLRVIAPSIEVVADAAPRRIARRIEKVEINRGWKDVPNQQQAQQLRARIKSEAKPPAELPPQPKFERVIARKGEPVPAQAGTPVAGAPVKEGETPAPAGASAGGTTATTDAPATADPAAPGRKGARGKKGANATAGATPAAPADSPTAATDPAAPTEDPGKPGRKGARGKKGAEATVAAKPGEAAPANPTAQTPDAGAPAATTTPGTATAPSDKPAATAEKPLTTPADAPDATTAEDSTKPGRKGRDAGKNARAGKKGATDAPPAATATSVDSAAAPAEAAPTARPSSEKDKPGRRKGQADHPEAAAPSPTADPARNARPDREMPPAGRRDRESGAAAPGAPAAPAAARPDRPDRPDRPARPEGANTRTERPDRPERPEAGGGARPEAASPDRAPRGDAAERRGSREGAGGGNEAARPGRGRADAPNAGAPAGVQPAAPAGRPAEAGEKPRKGKKAGEPEEQ